MPLESGNLASHLQIASCVTEPEFAEGCFSFGEQPLEPRGFGDVLGPAFGLGKEVAVPLIRRSDAVRQEQRFRGAILTRAQQLLGPLSVARYGAGGDASIAALFQDSRHAIDTRLNKYKNEY